MRRIFSVTAALIALLILVVGTCIYALSSHQILQSKSQEVQLAASGVALSLGREMLLLQQLVDSLAQSPEAVAAFSKADPEQLKQTAAQLEKYIPGILKLRLIIPGTQLSDDDVPVMGFADLDLVKETLATHQLPAIHDQDTNRHIAVAASTLKHNLSIGVLLASINPSIIHKNLQSLSLNEGYLKLVQGNLLLYQLGDESLKDQESAKLAIPNTRWVVQYWSSGNIDSTFRWLIAGVTSLGAIIAGLGIFIGFKYLDKIFSKDSATLIKVMKDLLSGNVNGNYPAHLAEMRVIINTMVQYRRVVDENGQEKHTSGLDLSKLNDFLDETEGVDYPEQTAKSQPRSVDMPEKPMVAEVPPTNTLSVLRQQNQASLPSIYNAFDIRGIIDKNLTKDLVYSIGQAYGSEAKIQGVQRIIMGYDGRLSSPALAESLAKGISSTGVDVLDIGMVPTPVMYFVAHHTEGRSGVMITGSHYPAVQNGLKMMLNGESLMREDIQQIKARVEAGDFMLGQMGNIERNNRYINEYIGMLSEEIHIVRPMKIVLDCGNGATSELAPKLLRTLGCEVIELFCDVDGTFPNHLPDPSRQENLGDMIAAVQHYQADIGIALDGDGDSLGVVDSKGRHVMIDRLMMLFAKDVLESRAGAQVIYDVSCSKYLGEKIVKFGGRPIISEAGDAIIRTKIRETGAKLAGEMGGHIFFNDRWFGFDDGLYAAARLIQILSADPRSSSDLFASLPDSVNTPELVVELPVGENLKIIEAMRANVKLKDAKVLDLDGLRYDFVDGSCTLRPSKSSPNLLVRFEGDTREVMERIQAQFKTYLTGIKSDLHLPF